MKTFLKIVGGFFLLIICGVAAAFYFTSGIVEEADIFIAHLQNGESEEAYEMLSSEFKRTTSKDQLDTFLNATGLLGAKNVQWNNRKVTMSEGLLDGVVTTANDTELPIEMHFVSEDSTWKILGIHKAKTGLSETESGGQEKQVVATADQIPPEEQQITLVQKAMYDFGVSVNEKNMTHFHENISRTWQSQYDVKKLDDAYKGLYGLNGDLAKISNLSPIFSEPASVNKHGVMKIAGYFPTNPKKVTFEQKFVQEGTQWKLLGFHINLKG